MRAAGLVAVGAGALACAFACIVACTVACNGRDKPAQRSPFTSPGEGGADLGFTPPHASGSGGADEQVIPDPEAPCDEGLPVAALDAYDGAAALGLCKRAVSADDWGLIEARWAMADGSDPDPQHEISYAVGHGVLTGFGSRVHPREGSRVLALSSGTARDPGDPQYENPEGYDKGYVSSSPDGYPKESPACEGVLTGIPHDDAALEVALRAPDGAQALAYDFDFFTYEWPDYVCSEFNDFFVALLDPRPPGQPDANISFDQLGNSVSVNNALVRVCTCAGGPPCVAPPQMPEVDYDCDEGADELNHTGFEGRAATSWLATKAPVGSGEVIRLRFAVYDSGDGILDSTVIIDNFRWLGESEDDPVTQPIE